MAYLTYSDMKEIWELMHAGEPVPPIVELDESRTVKSDEFFRAWGAWEAVIETAAREQVEFPIVIKIGI